VNQVNPRRARLLPEWVMGDRLRAGIPSRYVTSYLGQLSLAPPGSLNRMPASAGVRVGMSHVPGGV